MGLARKMIRRRRGWDNLREYHWNINITICKIDSLWEFDVWCREPKAGDLWQPGGMGWGERWEGSHLCLWPTHDDVWQRPSQYYNYPSIKINKCIFLESYFCDPSILTSTRGCKKVRRKREFLWKKCCQAKSLFFPWHQTYGKERTTSSLLKPSEKGFRDTFAKLDECFLVCGNILGPYIRRQS